MRLAIDTQVDLINYLILTLSSLFIIILIILTFELFINIINHINVNYCYC